MAVLLYRIDERLIHGQVVVGWGNTLHPDLIVVADDELAASTWEQELYALGLPQGLQAVFLDVATARGRLPDLQTGPDRVVVLTRGVESMLRLAGRGALSGAEVNVGGIHHASDRRQVLPYVFLSEAERTDLRRLAEAGATVSARDLPSARRVPLHRLLGEESA
jgi:PTS system mannose-specific IIB component/fructoselysine and glucoselysine-specific PTS system IIB component